MAKPMQIAPDCSDPTKLAEFWASALDYQVARASDDGERVWLSDPERKSPSLLLHRVPEPKTVKNRLHLDVYVTWDLPPKEAKPIIDVEAERLCAMGRHGCKRSSPMTTSS